MAIFIEKQENEDSQVQRAFLNNVEFDGGAKIITLVKLKNTRSSTLKNDYEIRIHDCGNRIKLHGSLKTKNGVQNAYRKIDTMIKVLSDLKGFIEQYEAKPKTKPKAILKKKIQRGRILRLEETKK